MPSLFGFRAKPPPNKWGNIEGWQDRLLEVREVVGHGGWRLELLTEEGQPTGTTAVVANWEAHAILRVVTDPETDGERGLADAIANPAPPPPAVVEAARNSGGPAKKPDAAAAKKPEPAASAASSGSGGGSATGPTRAHALPKGWVNGTEGVKTLRLHGLAFDGPLVLDTVAAHRDRGLTHCAVLTASADPMRATLEFHAAVAPPLAKGDRFWIRAVPRRFQVPTDDDPKTFRTAETGGPADVSARQPRPRNRIAAHVGDPVWLPVTVIDLNEKGNAFRAGWELPADWVATVGVQEAVIDAIRLPVPAAKVPITGPSSATKAAGPVAPCAYQSTGSKRQKRKAAGAPDEGVPKAKQEKIDTAPKKEEPAFVDQALDARIRLTVLRTVRSPLPDHGRFEPDIRHKEPFLSFRHAFHACLWANNATSAEIDSPAGLVYQVVQNVRLYADDWYEGGSGEAAPLPYPPDEPKKGDPIYDPQNEGWNVLDNPDRARQGGQCNQVGSLLVDVLATLGVAARVVEIESVWTTDGGQTMVRQLMKGYTLHGLLAVDFPSGTWCYDTTMSPPPRRWFGTLAQAKRHRDFTTFTGTHWVYTRFRGIELTPGQQEDATLAVLAAHIPAAASGSSGGAWSDREGNCGVLGPKAAQEREQRDKSDTEDGRTPEALYDHLRQSKDANAPRIRAGGAMLVPLKDVDFAVTGVAPWHYVVVRGPADSTIRLTATLPPSRGRTQWSIDDRAPVTSDTLDLPIHEARRFVVTAGNGEAFERVVVWVVWAEVAVAVDGELVADCPRSFNFGVGQPKSNPKHLGVIKAGKLAHLQAFGRQYARARLLPDGIGRVVKKGWKLERWISKEVTWIDGVAAPERSDVDDNVGPVSKGGDPKALSYTPSAADAIYLLDAPSIGRWEVPGKKDDWAEYYSETWMSFRHHVSLGGVRCSGVAEWSYGGYWVAYGAGTAIERGPAEVATDDVGVWVEGFLALGPLAMPKAPTFTIVKRSGKSPLLKRER